MPPENVPQGNGLLGPHALTPRERQVLEWLREAKTNWAIGQILGCSEETVKKHLQRAYHKLGVETRMEAAALLRGPDFPGLGHAPVKAGLRRRTADLA